MKRQYEYRLTMLMQGEWTVSTHDGQRLHQTLWAAEQALKGIRSYNTIPHRIERRSVNPWREVVL